MGDEALAAAHGEVAVCRKQIRVAMDELRALDEELESLAPKLDTAHTDVSMVAVRLSHVASDIKSQCTLSFARQEMDFIGRLVQNTQR